MDIQEALKIVKALADGVNPETGEVMPADSIYQRPQTIRALQRAVAGLEYVEQRERERQRKLPLNAGKCWSRAEDAQICDELRRGIDFHVISKTHNRTVGSIVARLVKLGKIAAQVSPSKVA